MHFPFALQEIINYDHQLCYKLIPKFQMKEESFAITFDFNSQLPKQDIPKMLNVYVTSFQNSFGIHLNVWKESEEFLVHFEINSSKSYELKLKSEQTNFIANEDKCSTEKSYYQCIGQEILKFKYCYPLYYKDLVTLAAHQNLTICQTFLENSQMKSKLFEFLIESNSFQKCKPFCSFYGYKGKISQRQGGFASEIGGSNSVTFIYSWQSTDLMISQEYLVYDIIGIIGSIGGSLGLFLGFSFLEFIIGILNNLEVWITRQN